MARKLKVYGFNWGGTHRAIIATTSWKKAAEAFGTTVGQITAYGGITGNPEECRIALANPELPIRRNDRGGKGPWMLTEHGYGWREIGPVATPTNDASGEGESG